MKKILTLLFIGVVVLAVYSPSLDNGFVWDDTALILRDPLIRSWRLIPEGFQHFLFTDATASDFYRPIQRLSYTVDYALFGLRPGGYHLTSILSQIAAAFAFLLFAREFSRLFVMEQRRRRGIALAATLLWAIHPVQTAAVVYISGRADPLAAMFGFCGLYFAMRTLERRGARTWIFTVAAALLFLLSALSKESGLLFLALSCAIPILRKLRAAAFRAAALGIVVAIVYASLRAGAQHIPPPQIHAPAPLLVRPIIAARAFAEYAGLVIFPRNLHMDRDVETHPTGLNEANLSSAAWRELQTLAGLLLLAAAIYWMLRSRRRQPAVFACLALAAISYLPFSGIFWLNATIAEHWIYIPSAFLLLAIANTVASALVTDPAQRMIRQRIVYASVFLCGLLLGARTFSKTYDWKDQRTFLERTIAAGGDSSRMLINLGALDSSEGRFDAARQNLQKALSKDSEQPFAILELAAVAVKQGDFKAAHELIDRATKMPLVEAQAHELRAVLENKETGRVDLMRLRLASRTGPPDWAIEKRYVNLLSQTGAISSAIAEVRSCLRTQWYRAESWQLLSELLTKDRHPAEAAQAAAQAKAYDVRLGEQLKSL